MVMHSRCDALTLKIIIVTSLLCGRAMGARTEDAGKEPWPWVSAPPHRGIVANQLAVVMNAADTQSVAVGTAYVAARRVPAANVVTLNFSTGQILSQHEFAEVSTDTSC